MHKINIWTEENGYQELLRTQENLDYIDSQDIKPAEESIERVECVSLEALPQYLPQYLLGIDISKWQGEMNWETAKLQGAKFAFIRAGFAGSSPGCYEDSQFARNSTQAFLYIPVGFYWFFRGTTDPIVQADFFCNLIEDKLWEIYPVVDIELQENQTPHQIRIQAEKFIQRVFERLGVKPQIVYTRSSFWNLYVEDSPVWETLDLWIARYDSTISHPWGDNQFVPRDWDDWKFWQFTSKGDGLAFGAESLSIDLNYFNGLEGEFYDYIEPTPPSPQPDIVETKQLVVLADALNIRNKPNTTGTIKGILYAGDDPCEFEEIINANGATWSRIGWKQYACKKTNSGIVYMDYT